MLTQQYAQAEIISTMEIRDANLKRAFGYLAVDGKLHQAEVG